MKTIAWLVAGITLLAAAVYTFVSLARWEWNRALFFAIVFVAAEVGLGIALVLRRLARVEALVTDLPAPDPGARRALRDTRGEQERFAWLRVDPTEVVGRTNVFITLLVGGGVILSGGAWLLDKLASSTVDPRREQRLGRELDGIAYRPGLLVDEVDTLARPSLDRDDPRVRSFLGTTR
ncbi:MAG TPA: hypothetical protein VFU19_10145 [Iamia sp.]|nr:hypothetical protein [Iamia sp.]